VPSLRPIEHESNLPLRWQVRRGSLGDSYLPWGHLAARPCGVPPWRTRWPALAVPGSSGLDPLAGADEALALPAAPGASPGSPALRLPSARARQAASSSVTITTSSPRRCGRVWRPARSVRAVHDTSGSYASYEVSYRSRLPKRVRTYLGRAFSIDVAGSGPGRS
jgi:hypothetical protein